jgi:catechol 2,3-dioxygenase-like lactoylglutathione lyase family enzyme
MIFGAHVLLFSNDPDADRAFLRNILGFRSVDAGGGWLIFALPPAEVAVHPTMEDSKPAHPDQEILRADLYLMCDDIRGLLESLKAKGVNWSPPTEEKWGIKTSILLPGGGRIGLYQPSHPMAITSLC